MKRSASLGHCLAASWTPHTVTVESEPVQCAFACDDAKEPSETLCIVPTQALRIIADPLAEIVRGAPNVLDKWTEWLLWGGANVLLMHGRWFDHLDEMREQLLSGQDPLAAMTARIGAVTADALRRGWGKQGRIILMGSSRHGFATLHAMANLADISAGVAHQPVVWWPKLRQFEGMGSHPLIAKNDLNRWVDRYPPRPLLIQTGYDDQRIGSEFVERLTAPLAGAYKACGAEEHFTHDLMHIPGHSGRVPESAIYCIVPWLVDQGLL